VSAARTEVNALVHGCRSWTKISTEVASPGRYVMFSIAEVAVSQRMFANILMTRNRFTIA
jgi:hypothetical protein